MIVHLALESPIELQCCGGAENVHDSDAHNLLNVHCSCSTLQQHTHDDNDAQTQFFPVFPLFFFSVFFNESLLALYDAMCKVKGFFFLLFVVLCVCVSSKFRHEKVFSAHSSTPCASCSKKKSNFTLTHSKSLQERNMK